MLDVVVSLFTALDNYYCGGGLLCLILFYFLRTLVDNHYYGHYASCRRLLCLMWWYFFRTVLDNNYCGGNQKQSKMEKSRPYLNIRRSQIIRHYQRTTSPFRTDLRRFFRRHIVDRVGLSNYVIADFRKSYWRIGLRREDC